MSGNERSSARLELWESLATLEDALNGGIRMPRTVPDFSPLDSPGPAPIARTGSGSAEAPTEASRGLPVGNGSGGRPAVLQESPAGYPDPGSESASRALAALRDRALACTACGLSATRHSVVFGQGADRPLVLVIGEGPGAEEDRLGLPFVGASGKLLDRMLAAIGLSREENCYIANIVKCRPPQNREPAPDERDACIGFLRSQIALLAPRAILCAGRTAAQSLLGTTEGINRLRGRELAFEGIPLVASYHPSALLRDESLKRPAWEDLKRLRALLPDG